MIPMQAEGWMKFTQRFVVFYLGLAVLNEIVWRGWGTDVGELPHLRAAGGELPVRHGAGAAVHPLRRAGQVRALKRA